MAFWATMLTAMCFGDSSQGRPEQQCRHEAEPNEQPQLSESVSLPPVPF